MKVNKTMGQNFLIDQNILHKILNAANIDGDEFIIEIGPGIGSLTQFVLNKLDRGYLLAIEKDKKFSSILNNFFSKDNFELIEADALAINWSKLIINKNKSGKKLKVLANLPYYIASQIIIKLLETDLNINSMIFMVQREVAKRMVALPGTKDYSSLSIVIQFYSKPEIISDVPPTVFIPNPDVYSSIIKLKPYNKPPYDFINKNFFFKIVKSIFQQRRKNIKNSLLNSSLINLDKKIILSALREADINSRIRGEKLEIENIVKLSNILWRKVGE